MSVNFIVCDSSGLVSLVKPDDQLHAKAVSLRDTVVHGSWQLLLPAEVLAETANLLGKKVGKQMAIATVNVLLEQCDKGNMTLISPSQSTLRTASALLNSASGSPSFIDCLVMAYADEYQTPYIFGFDTAFQKNGYRLPGEGEESVTATEDGTLQMSGKSPIEKHFGAMPHLWTAPGQDAASYTRELRDSMQPKQNDTL